ncbi:MAG TPA: hypothetical protein VGX46_14925 [Vicinamibacterales bacterium]|nr:hypothetical protein [Vicinamibacterales bacterium]
MKSPNRSIDAFPDAFTAFDFRNYLAPHFMLGGFDVVTASRNCFGVPDARDRLRRQLLVTLYFTVSGAITHVDTGRAIIVSRNSCGRSVACKQGLLA